MATDNSVTWNGITGAGEFVNMPTTITASNTTPTTWTIDLDNQLYRECFICEICERPFQFATKYFVKDYVCNDCQARLDKINPAKK